MENDWKTKNCVDCEYLNKEYAHIEDGIIGYCEIYRGGMDDFGACQHFKPKKDTQ